MSGTGGDRWKLAAILIPFGASIFGAAVGSITTIWVSYMNRPPTPTAKLYLECTLGPPGPLRTASDKIANVLFLYQDFSEGGGLAAVSDGTNELRVTDNQLSPVGRCRVFNYGSATAANVILTFVALHKQGDMHGDTVVGNKVRGQATKKVNINKIDPGSDNAFTFYVLNQSNDFVFFGVEQAATFQYLGEPTPRSVFLSVSMAIPFFPPANLSSLSPATPAAK
jgi:hypothetical protein